MDRSKIDASRRDCLAPEFEKPYFLSIQKKLESLSAAGTQIFPPENKIFSAYEMPLGEVKVVILGQDPYHAQGQAHGLAFSVNEGVAVPPSLRNIYKELQDSVGGEVPKSGDLSQRAKQGVFLLNSVLTVTEQEAGSHRKIGREQFTDATIKVISDMHESVVFMLRGKFAQSKAILVDETKHLVLQAPHPSPLSSYRGFFGCNHFALANEYLLQKEKTPISWLAN